MTSGARMVQLRRLGATAFGIADEIDIPDEGYGGKLLGDETLNALRGSTARTRTDKGKGYRGELAFDNDPHGATNRLPDGKFRGTPEHVYSCHVDNTAEGETPR